MICKQNIDDVFELYIQISTKNITIIDNLDRTSSNLFGSGTESPGKYFKKRPNYSVQAVEVSFDITYLIIK